MMSSVSHIVVEIVVKHGAVHFSLHFGLVCSENNDQEVDVSSDAVLLS